MRAADVMTTQVLTVASNATVREVATLMAERGISGVPVVDAQNRVVGMVTEGDLIHRIETGTERATSWRLNLVTASRDVAREYVKSHGRSVSDVMTRNVLSVTEDTHLGDIASLMEENGIRRVPVVREGKLIGLVTRSNLVRALAALMNAPPSPEERDDRAIRAKLLAEIKGRKWVHASPSDIIVKNRVVHIWSPPEPEEELRALRIAAENIPGVERVEEHVVPPPTTPPV